MKRSPVVLLISVFLAILFSPIAKADASLIITSANTVNQDNPAAPVHIEGSWLGISPDCTHPKSDSYILLGVKVVGAPQNYKGYNYNYGMPKYDKIEVAVGSNDPKDGFLKSYFSEPREYAESSNSDFTIRISTDYNEISFNISITTEGWPPGTYPVAITGYAGSISLCGPEVSSNMTIVIPAPEVEPVKIAPLKTDVGFDCDDTLVGENIRCYPYFAINSGASSKGVKIDFSSAIKKALFEVWTKVEGQKTWKLNEKFYVIAKPYSEQQIKYQSTRNLKNLKMSAKPLLVKFQVTADSKYAGNVRVLPRNTVRLTAPGSVYVGESFTAKIVTNKLFTGKCSIGNASTTIRKGIGYIKLRTIDVGRITLSVYCESNNWIISGASWKMYSRG